MTRRIERLELAGGGWIELREDGEGVAAGLEGVAESRFDAHWLAADEGRLRGARHPHGDRVLLGRVRSDRLFLLRLPDAELAPIDLPERLAGAWQLAIVTSGDLFVALTESGVYAIEADGRERWHIAGTTYDWRYVGDQDGDVWLSDTNGNLIGFDAESGEERSL
jgi:hypothetical protein